MLIFGVDPGLTRFGGSVIEKNGSSLNLKNSFLLETNPDSDQSNRLFEIYEKLEKVFRENNFNIVAIERPFLTAHNPNTVFGVVQSIAIVQLLCAKNRIPVEFFTPPQIKTAVSGNSKANKTQIQTAVTKILKLQPEEINKIVKKADVYDAIAVGITCANQNVHLQKLTKQSAKSTKAQQIWSQAAARQKKRNIINI